MSRYRASLIHLLISVVLIGLVVAVACWVWYPGPVFEVVGAASTIRLLILITLALGPLLTLIVYKESKPWLRLDLAVIAILQIAALAHGTYRLYERKPDYLVFAVDRLQYVSEKQIDPAAIRYEQLQGNRSSGPIRVFARLPDDPVEYGRFLESVVLEGRPDLESRAEYWEPWTSGTEVIRGRMTPFADIRTASPRELENLQEAARRYGDSYDALGMLPIGGIDRDLGMLLDGDTLEILDMIDVNPWHPAAP